MFTRKILIALSLALLGCVYSCKEKEIIRTLPEVEISEINYITDTSFNCVSKITNNGNDDIINKGVCWTTTLMPLKSMNSIDNGGGAEDFTSEIDGLIQTGVYYIRAFATNSVGTTYGDVMQFQTKPGDGKQVIDYDGRIYNTVEIGDQTWLTENSYAKHFQNGDDVYPGKSARYYNDKRFNDFLAENDADNTKNSGQTNYYGETFTWPKVIDERNVCPKGWRSASDDDWFQLIENVGGVDIAGGKLKEIGLGHWQPPNKGATNEFGFTALPSGYNQSVYVGVYAFFWSTTEYDSTNAIGWFLKYDEEGIFDFYADKTVGASVRCIKNEIMQ